MTATATLGEIVEKYGGLIQTGPFGSQLHQSDYLEEGIPVVMPKDIRHGRVDESDIARISEIKAQALSRHFLKSGSIVFPRRGEIGKCAYIDADQEGFLCGTGCIKIEPPQNMLRSKFLYYYLGIKQVVEWLERNAIGTTMLNLNSKILGNLNIPLFSPQTQDWIVSILSPYDDLIENNRRRIQLLEQAAQTIYKEWFVRLRFPGHEHVKVKDGVPEGWERKPLGEIAATNAESYKAGELPGRINYTDISAVKEGRIVAKNMMSSAEAPGRARRKAKAGDTIWSNVRPNLRAYAFVLDPEENDVFSTGFTVLSPIAIPFTYLHLLVTTDEFVGHLANHATGASYPAVRPDDFERAIVPVPSARVLKLFQDKIEPIYRLVHVLEKEMASLSQARYLLLPQLMNKASSVNAGSRG